MSMSKFYTHDTFNYMLIFIFHTQMYMFQVFDLFLSYKPYTITHMIP